MERGGRANRPQSLRGQAASPIMFDGVRLWLFGSVLVVAWFFFWPWAGTRTEDV